VMKGKRDASCAAAGFTRADGGLLHLAFPLRPFQIRPLGTPSDVGEHRGIDARVCSASTCERQSPGSTGQL
jgi:hypothetical protein